MRRRDILGSTGAAVPVLEGLARDHGKVTLVGHSFGGL